jgi:hypothetical protein
MPILKRTPPPADADAAGLRRQLLEVTRERDALRAQLEGDIPSATYWLQAKVWRQAAALDTLNRRVTAQRLVLRTLEQMGRGLTRAEFLAARNTLTDPQLRDRIGDPGEYAPVG